MSQDIEVYQERIRKLRARIKEGKHHDKQGVRDEIRALYIDMAGSIRALVKAQETLREINDVRGTRFGNAHRSCVELYRDGGF
jgi:hypothetical protein